MAEDGEDVVFIGSDGSSQGDSEATTFESIPPNTSSPPLLRVDTRLHVDTTPSSPNIAVAAVAVVSSAVDGVPETLHSVAQRSQRHSTPSSPTMLFFHQPPQTHMPSPRHPPSLSEHPPLPPSQPLPPPSLVAAPAASEDTYISADAREMSTPLPTELTPIGTEKSPHVESDEFRRPVMAFGICNGAEDDIDDVS